MPVVVGVGLPLVLALVLGLAPRQFGLGDDLQRLQNTQEPNQAAQSLTNILVIEPWRVDLWESLGDAELSRNNLAASVEAYKMAAEQGSLSVDGQVVLGEVYLELGDSSSAVRVWRALIASGQADRSVYLRTTALLRAEGDIPRAADVLAAWLVQSPEDAEVEFQLGLLLTSNDPESALAHLQSASESEQGTAPPVDHLKRVLRTVLFEDDPAYQQVLIGRALASQGYWDVSVRAFERAVVLAPEYAEAWALLGEARYQMDGGGQEALERAIALDPQSTVVQALKALHLRRQDSAEQALEALFEVAAAEPEEAIWQVEIGSTLAEMGDLVTAQSHFIRAVEIEPDNAMMWYYLARFCLINHVDVRTEALPAARQALLLAPMDVRMADLMGWVMLELDDAASAERFLLQAADQDPMYNLTYLHLGQFYALQGENELAVWNLERAVELSWESDPVFVMAERLLADLRDR